MTTTKLQLALAAGIQLGLIAGSPAAVPSICEDLGQGVVVVRDDVGMWRGDLSLSITHQSAAPYQARKVLDLSGLTEAHWNATHTVRLSMYFVVRDYSPHLGSPPNGLDESFEIVVNGHVHPYSTGSGVPTYNELAPQQFAWYDFELPKSELTRGPNEIIVRKAPSEKNDDYIYLGIDETEARGNSSVTFDGQNWLEHALTVPGGKGEYMIRLYLLAGDQSLTTTWTPADNPPLDDPHGLILYAGSRTAELRDGQLLLSPTDAARVELAPDSWDPLQPLTVKVEGDSALEFRWLTTRGEVSDLSTMPGLPAQCECPTQLVRDFSGMEVRSVGGVPCSIKRLTISGRGPIILGQVRSTCARRLLRQLVIPHRPSHSASRMARSGFWRTLDCGVCSSPERNCKSSHSTTVTPTAKCSPTRPESRCSWWRLASSVTRAVASFAAVALRSREILVSPRNWSWQSRRSWRP